MIENNLRDALAALEAAVKAMPTAHPKLNLLPLFARIDELAGQLPKGTDPNLIHYLQKKSYEKARLWLDDRNRETAGRR